MYVKRGNSSYNDATNRVLIDGVYGSAKTCNDYIELDRSLRGAIGSGLPADTDREYLLDTAGGRNSGWMLLEEFIETFVPQMGRP